MYCTMTPPISLFESHLFFTQVATMKQWLYGLFQEAPGEPSVRRVVFFLAFLFGAGLCLLGFRFDVGEPVERLAMAIVTCAFGVMGAGRFA